MASGDANKMKQLTKITLLTLVGTVLFVYLLVKLFTSGSGIDTASPTMTSEAVSARLQPVGQIKIVEAGPPGSKSGKAIYESVCFSCHATGAANSPKFADNAAWSTRIAKGYDALVKTAISGLNAMPARGGAPDLTDDEIRRAVAYISNAAGAKFREPPAPVIASAPAN